MTKFMIAYLHCKFGINETKICLNSENSMLNSRHTSIASFIYELLNISAFGSEQHEAKQHPIIFK